jgi:hypothetical protein
LEAVFGGDPKEGRREEPVAEKKQQQPEELTPEELEKQNGEELPDREAMSLINPGVDGIATIAPEPVPPAIE